MIYSENTFDTIFDHARRLSDLGKRKDYLDQVCADNPEMREEIESLLAAYTKADGFMKTKVNPQQEVLPVTHYEGAGTLIGSYKLLEKIGEGGFGVVYIAEQREPIRRRVALKIIKLGMDTKSVIARFEAERQALAMMEHPGIAKVFDAGATKTGRPYFVMELVRGIPITAYCNQGKLSMKKRLDLFIQVCHAIQHAHQKGIIHRDIKPSNILVTIHDDAPIPKVIDFGIAKATTDQRLTEKTLFTACEQFIGTPAYISPEQAEMSGLDIDTRSDIYSLGVLLYEILTDRTPFDTTELMSLGIDKMRKTIREKEPVRPSTRLRTLQGEDLTMTAKRQGVDALKLVNQLRGDLDCIVMKCLEKERSRRYETANGLAMDLKRHLNNEPVVARPHSRLYEFQKTVRRHKVGFGATAGIIILLAVGATVTTWQATVAIRAKQAETQLRFTADFAREQAEEARKLAEIARAHETEMRRIADAQLYAGEMSLAQLALERDNLGLTMELLDRQRPEPDQPDRRGWEWRYLWQQSRSDALYTLCKQSGRIKGLAISHDRKWLAIDAEGVSVWNLASHREVMRFEDAGSVAFSPVGPLLAVWDPADPEALEKKYKLHFWNVETGRFIPNPPSPNLVDRAVLMYMGFTRDGQSLVSASRRWGSDNNQLVRWRVSDGKRLETYPIQLRGPGVGLPVSLARDVNLVAVAEQDRRIRVIDVNSGIEKFSVQAPGKGWLEAVALSADGRTLAACSGTDETTIRLWDVPSGRELGVLEGHHAYVIALVFWPDGKILASAGADQTIRIWDVAEKRTLEVLRGHRDEIHRLALLPDKSTLISGAKNGTVMVWDTSAVQRKKSIITLPSHVNGFWILARESDAILTLLDQDWLTRWSGPDFQKAETLFQIRPGPHGVCLSTNQRLLATGTTTGAIRLWDVPKRRFLREIQISTGSISPRAFLANDTRLAVWIERQRSVGIYDVVTSHQISSWSDPENEWGKVIISPDGRWCLTGAGNETALVRELHSGREIGTVPTPGRADPAFSPDGKQLAIPFSSGLVRRWDVPTLKERATFKGLLRAAHSVAFSPDGHRLAVGSGADESLNIWDLESGQLMLRLPGEGGPCWKTSFSPDGNMLVTRHELGILDIWRAPSWEEIIVAEAKQGSKSEQP